jgi:hypothetical protein
VKTAAAVLAAVALVGAAAYALGRSGGDGTSQAVKEATATKAWEQKAGSAFGGAALSKRIIDLVNGAEEWQAGTRPAEQFADELATREGDLESSERAVRALEPFPYDAHVTALYTTSAGLYTESVRAYRAAVAIPGGDVRDQVIRLAKRLRELGDRIFDRGHALVKPYLHEPPTEGIDIRLPEEVPMWEAEGLAAGPPLGPPPPAPLPLPPLRQATRPQQPRSAWIAAVRAAEIPPADALRQAITGRLSDTLGRIGERFVAAAELLRTTPDPSRDREGSARFRLTLLVYADAARAAQAATLVGDPEPSARLDTIARRVVALADEMPKEPGA